MNYLNNLRMIIHAKHTVVQTFRSANSQPRITELSFYYIYIYKCISFALQTYPELRTIN